MTVKSQNNRIISILDGFVKSQFFATKAQRHEEMPIENIQVFLCVRRDLCVRTTFYDLVNPALALKMQWCIIPQIKSNFSINIYSKKRKK